MNLFYTGRTAADEFADITAASLLIHISNLSSLNVVVSNYSVSFLDSGSILPIPAVTRCENFVEDPC